MFFSNKGRILSEALEDLNNCSHTFQMAANSSTGVLDSCKCRVSIRKEEKGGKNFRKVDLRFPTDIEHKVISLLIPTSFVRLALSTLT